MQGKKSSRLYFIKSGRVKLLRNIDFAEAQHELKLNNYHDVFKEPTDAQRASNIVKTKQLEVMELSSFECFGENPDSL